jgi:hypothetical protein
MISRSRVALFVASALAVAGCADHPDKRTLASLHRVVPDTSDVQVEDGLDK